MAACSLARATSDIHFRTVDCKVELCNVQLHPFGTIFFIPVDSLDPCHSLGIWKYPLLSSFFNPVKHYISNQTSDLTNAALSSITASSIAWNNFMHCCDHITNVHINLPTVHPAGLIWPTIHEANSLEII